jgi:hypothetical protein
VHPALAEVRGPLFLQKLFRHALELALAHGGEVAAGFF